MSDSIKTAVIGVGNIGYHHARIYDSLPQCTLVGVCDSNFSRAQEVAQRFETKAYANLAELLRNESPDAISLCIPTAQHYEIALELLFKSIHVLVEKPIATSVAQTRHLLDVARQKELVLTAGHVERFNPAVIALKKLLSSGELGKPIQVIAKRVGGYPPQITDVGVYEDLMIHDIDVICSLLEDYPISIQKRVHHVVGRSQDDASSLFMEFKDSTAYIISNWITPVKIRTLSVTCTRGHVELNYITQNLDIYEHNADPKDFEETDFQQFVNKYGTINKRTIEPEKKEPLLAELENFVDSILNKTKLHVTPDQVIRTMMVLYDDC